MTRVALLSLAVVVGFASPAAADTFQVGDFQIDPCEAYEDACVLAWETYDSLDVNSVADVAAAVLGSASDPTWVLDRLDEVSSAALSNLPQGPPDPQVPAVNGGPSPPVPAPSVPSVALYVPDGSADLVVLPDLAPLVASAGAAEDAAMEPGRAAAAEAGARLPSVPAEAAALVVRLASQVGTLHLPAIVAEPEAAAGAPAAEPLPAAEALGARGAPFAADAAAQAHVAPLPGEARALAAPAGLGLDAPAVAPALAAPEGAWPGFALLLEPIAIAAVAFLGVLLLVPPLYHRLQKQRLLDHGARSRLFELVGARPGIHIEEVARAASLSRSTAVYHLRLMVRHGLLVAMGGSKSVHYYPNDGGQDPALRERRALLTSPRTRLVAACVMAQPGISRTQLAAASGITVSTLSWHLGRLLQLGLVQDRLLPGGHRALYPAPGVEELLKPWLEAGAMPPAASAPAEPSVTAAAVAFAALPPPA